MPSSHQSLLFTGAYADATHDGIHAWSFDQSTGALAPRGTYAGIANPSFLVVHPNGRWLYSVSETGGGGAVCALRFDSSDQQISFELINSQPSNGDSPCHLHLDATGTWLFVANYSSGSASVLPIQEDGSLGASTSVVQHQGQSVNPQRQEGPHAHSATPTPDNRFVIVADLGLDQLLVYAFDNTAGTLTPHSTATARPGAGPRHVTFHPSGAYVYVANELDSSVSVYDYDAANASLSERQSLPTLPAADPTNSVADIHISEAGDRLYVSNRGHNSVAVFDVDAQGGLSSVGFPACGGDWPRNFALAPGGRFLLAANQYSNDLSVLPLLEGSPALGQPVARADVAQATCVVFVAA